MGNLPLRLVKSLGTALGDIASWNRANPANDKLPEWTSPTPLPGDVPVSGGIPGVQRYVLPTVMAQANQAAKQAALRRPFFPYDATGLGGGHYNTPIAPGFIRYQPAQNNMLSRESPDIQGTMNPGLIPLQGSSGVHPLQGARRNRWTSQPTIYLGGR